MKRCSKRRVSRHAPVNIHTLQHCSTTAARQTETCVFLFMMRAIALLLMVFLTRCGFGNPLCSLRPHWHHLRATPVSQAYTTA